MINRDDLISEISDFLKKYYGFIGKNIARDNRDGARDAIREDITIAFEYLGDGNVNVRKALESFADAKRKAQEFGFGVTRH